MDLNAQFLDNVHINFDSGTLWVMNLALALVMFGIALELSFSDFKRVISNPKPVLVGVLSQFMVLPALTYCLVVLIEPMPSMALGMFMVAACPGGNVSNFISHLAGGNTALSVSLTAMATILAVVMTPFNLQFWGGMYPPSADILQSVSISFLEMARLVLILLGI
ncbi:MAG: bile acid:sodium symporter family protein, partial [Flavobacteriaceae bacterium]